LYRLNGVLSFSSGTVIGRKDAAQRGVLYVSTNIDVSNLGPFQQIFARRDTP
jgi:hypothetical protein